MLEKRLAEARRLWLLKENRWLYTFIGFLAGMFFSLWVNLDTSLVDSLFPEFIGILFTVVIIDRAYAHQQDISRANMLIARIRSGSSADALSAIEELRDLGKLTDGSLRKKRFVSVNLQHTFLVNADLSHTNLYGSNLEFTDLRGAILDYSNLKSCNLTEANLENASLDSVQMDGNTILPDGSRFQISEGLVTQVNRFTDQDAKNFWRSKNMNSPAYYSGDN